MSREKLIASSEVLMDQVADLRARLHEAERRSDEAQRWLTSLAEERPEVRGVVFRAIQSLGGV